MTLPFDQNGAKIIHIGQRWPSDHLIAQRRAAPGQQGAHQAGLGQGGQAQVLLETGLGEVADKDDSIDGSGEGVVVEFELVGEVVVHELVAGLADIFGIGSIDDFSVPN